MGFVEHFYLPDEPMQAFDLFEMPVKLGFCKHLGLNKDQYFCWL